MLGTVPQWRPLVGQAKIVAFPTPSWKHPYSKSLGYEALSSSTAVHCWRNIEMIERHVRAEARVVRLSLKARPVHLTMLKRRHRVQSEPTLKLSSDYKSSKSPQKKSQAPNCVHLVRCRLYRLVEGHGLGQTGTSSPHFPQ